MPRKWLLAGLVLLLSAGAAVAARERPVAWVAEAIAAAGGLDEPPAVTVDHTDAYSVTPLPIVSLLPPGTAGVEPDATGTVAIPVACPADLAGREIVARLDVWAPVEMGETEIGDHSSVVVVRCPGAGEKPPIVSVHGIARGPSLSVGFRGFVPPAGRVEAPALPLGKGARLHFAIGLASPLPAAEERPARFRLRARDGAGHEEVVFEHVLDPARKKTDRTWVPFDVPLDPVRARLGETVTFVFETESAGAPDALVFPAWGDPVITEPVAATAPRRPNVVLVSIDTLRADHLGCYGFPLPTTPHLDALAKQGTLFAQTIAQANWTRPGHAAILTGLFPCVTGATGRDGAPMAAGVEPLAEILRHRGYATGAVTEDATMDPLTFHRGFGSFFANSKLGQARGAGGPTGEVEETVARGLAWIDRHRDDEFFLFLHTYQVHAPYTPPPGYQKAVEAEQHAGNGLRIPKYAGDSWAYAGEIRYTDEVLGRFLAALDRQGLAERTIVVVTSDHGEAFGEHDNRWHGTTLFEEEVRVPMIWRAPGLVAAGRRIEEPVGQIDVVPTLLGLLGIPAPYALDGRSLQPFLAPELQLTPPELQGRLFPIISLRPGELALDAGSWKAIFRGKIPKLYLLGPDPYEIWPIRSQMAMPALEQKRQEFTKRCQTGNAAFRKEEKRARPAPPQDPEQARKLRALGYVD